MNLLLILTHSPDSKIAWHAVQLAEAACHDAQTQVATFFYQDAVQVANAFRWQPQDRPNLQQAWQDLASNFAVKLPVCVSAALARGITDIDNAKRHQIHQPQHLQKPDKPTEHTPLLGNNLAEHFELVGLGELAEKMHWADKVVRL